MADGIAIIEFNLEGEARLKEYGLTWFDFRLEDVCFDDAEGTDQLASQLPTDLKNVLVTVIFDYKTVCSNGYEGDYECDEYFNLISYTIVKEDYKEFLRLQVTEELKVGIGGFQHLHAADTDEVYTFNLNDREYYTNLVADWEEFYKEEFKPYQKEVEKKEIDILKLWDTASN